MNPKANRRVELLRNQTLLRQSPCCAQGASPVRRANQGLGILDVLERFNLLFCNLHDDLYTPEGLPDQIPGAPGKMPPV